MTGKMMVRAGQGLVRVDEASVKQLGGARKEHTRLSMAGIM